MNHSIFLNTSRLMIEPLKVDDTRFIRELVNTDGWLRFIGDRNVHSEEDASAYIQRIIGNPDIHYWVVKTKDEQASIGIITYIKREYLEHPDIGFAFLPAFSNKGYAFEAATAVMNEVMERFSIHEIWATTIPENTSSIRLLKKLGLNFTKEIKREEEIMHVYAASTDKLNIDRLTRAFFEVFTNKGKSGPNCELLHSLCIPEILVINRSGPHPAIFDLESFIEPRQKILTDGTLTDFEESETAEQTEIFRDIAQRHALYQKSGKLNGEPFTQSGQKFLQFLRTSEGWRISSVIWQDENSL